MADSWKILVVDDEAHQRRILCDFLGSQGYPVQSVSRGADALSLIKNPDNHIRVVLTDLAMPSMDGIELVRQGKEVDPQVDFIIATAHGTIESAIKALKAGAFDYLIKPLEFEEVSLRIKRLIELRSLEKRARSLEQENKMLRGGDSPIGESKSIKQLVSELEKVSKTNATILFNGETGVGKEVLARFVHEHSPRASGPFVAVNCAAIPDNLLESEFFGHEKGAFTGADSKIIGLFERADGGTLFLDEIGEMDIRLQPKILRAIEEKKVKRVGGTSELSVDVRFISATHRDLKKSVAEGRFREDLFYRLNVVQVRIPPLRERAEDIPHFVRYFVSKFQKELGIQIEGVDDSFLKALSQYSFPGNVRELANLVERAMIYSNGGKLTSQLLSLGGQSFSESVSQEEITSDSGKSLNDRVAQYEKSVIREALAVNTNDVDRAAAQLGVSRSTLYSKISKYDIK